MKPRPASKNGPTELFQPPARLAADFRRYVCQTSAHPIGIVVESARGAQVRDRSGRRYLDFVSGLGVNALGHSHPAAVRAIRAQIARYLHVMVYGEFVQEPQVRLARLLARIAPVPLSVTYFTNSGTEAVEVALKVAKKYAGRRRLVAFQNSYHGDTHGALSVTGRAVYRRPFEPLLPDVTFLPFGAADALGAIDRRTAAVIIEPIQGEGGVRVPPDDFLPALRRRCRAVGALLIVDEVLTGFGRTGRMFGFEHSGIVPDIVVMAKALGGGMPLGGFLMPPRIARVLAVDPPLSHVTTFGGHPVSCAAGAAALEWLQAKDLPARAARLGDYFIDQLNKISEDINLKSKVIIDVRGRGLLIGLELATPALARRFVGRCRRAGLLLGWTLHSNTLIRLAPPLTITRAELDAGLAILAASLAAR